MLLTCAKEKLFSKTLQQKRVYLFAYLIAASKKYLYLWENAVKRWYYGEIIVKVVESKSMKDYATMRLSQCDIVDI